MAPRKPKPTENDDTNSNPSRDSTPAVLKPNTTKAKVEKPKSDKPKTTKPKAVKKVATEGEVEEKEKEKKVVKAKTAKKEVGGEDGDGPVKAVKVNAGKGDGKEKVKPVTGEEAVQLILNYLVGQNRPYSATEISANLHGKVTKTNADKLLKEMEQNGQIMGKATKKDGGGQWVFWPLQNASDAASPTELAAMDVQISSLKESNPILKNSLKTLSTQLSTLLSAPTSSELSSRITALQVQTKEKKEKLEGYKNSGIKMVTKEELEKVEKEWKYWSTKRMARKKAFGNLEGELLDGMSKEDLWDKAGLEEDCFVG